MTMSHRVERFSSTLKHCLADILINEINNPKLKTVVIAEVITAHDLKQAKIFVAAAVGDVDEIILHLTKAKGGHPGGSLSISDILTALYFGRCYDLESGIWQPVFNFDQKNLLWHNLDRVILN